MFGRISKTTESIKKYIFLIGIYIIPTNILFLYQYIFTVQNINISKLIQGKSAAWLLALQAFASHINRNEARAGFYNNNCDNFYKTYSTPVQH